MSERNAPTNRVVLHVVPRKEPTEEEQQLSRKLQTHETWQNGKSDGRGDK